MQPVKLTKIQFKNRTLFGKSIAVVLNVNTRLNSASDLMIDYWDMIYTFSDEYHADRAIVRLRENHLEQFEVVRNA